MKEYLKVYGVTVLVSAVIVLVPWVFDRLGITTGIDVLEWQGILFGIFALIFFGNLCASKSENMETESVADSSESDDILHSSADLYRANIYVRTVERFKLTNTKTGRHIFCGSRFCKSKI